MTSCSKLLNTIGLGSVIVGCGLLYKFGLPPDFDALGRTHIIGEQTDAAEKAKGDRYRCLGRIGIALIGLGSLFQIAATWA